MLWTALGISEPGIIACVGAGGKTSLLQSLAVCACRRGVPVMVTTTTRMLYNQIAGYKHTLTANYTAGQEQVAAALGKKGIIAWLSGLAGEKVIGLPADWIDRLSSSLPSAYFLVEADGARCSLIKAPAEHEPVVPASTAITVGVLNLSVLGQHFSETNTYRMDLVSKIIHKQAGEIAGWLDLARLTVHRQGIFQYARGTKVLLLSGGGQPGSQAAAAQIAAYCRLANAAIERVVVSTGYGDVMLPAAVYQL